MSDVSRYCTECERLSRRVEALEAELSKHQESEFHPDWSMLEATRASLRDHQGIIRELQADVDRLQRAADETPTSSPKG